MALSILSGMEVHDFIRCIQNRDYLPLTRLPGVGRKTAERLVIELSGKMQLNLGVSSNSAMQSDSAFVINSPEEDAIAALISLGYKPALAKSAILNVGSRIEEKTSQALIRAALQNLIQVNV